jgi:hypothetical protein
MADRAKDTSKKKKTYASAVVGIEDKNDFFTLAKCSLKRPAGLPNGRIPNTKEANSFFVDLKSTTATNAEVLNAINIAGIVGANVRDDLWVIEFVCKDEASVDVAMNNPFTIEGRTPVEAIMPRHKTNKLVLIKVANVPFGQKEELTQAIGKYWSTYGKVIDVQPYQFPGRPWLTKRWDVLLQLNDEEKKLNAPPVFNIEGYTDTLISTWNGAKKACLRCLAAGHSTSKCPNKNPKNQKVGESANPLQKINGGANVGQSKNRTKKESKIPQSSTPETQPLAAVPATVTAATTTTTPIPVASEQVGATQMDTAELDLSVSSQATRDHIGILAITNARSMSMDEFDRARPLGIHPFLQQMYRAIGEGEYAAAARQSSVPVFHQQATDDPDTPKKGNKRQAKEDVWTPTLRQVMDKLAQLRLCVGCWRKGHVIVNCDMGKRGTLNESNLGQVLRHPSFKPILAAWSHQRHQQGYTWVLEEEAEVFIPLFCIKCHKEGHTVSECRSKYTCTHCKGDHLRIDCPTAPPYAYEQ